MAVKFTLPDFEAMTKEVAAEVLERVERRTPRSNIDPKVHAQDKWELVDEGDDKIHIKNDVHYVVHLEYGTSKMAGAHMVATTLEEVPDIVAKAFENVKNNSN